MEDNEPMVDDAEGESGESSNRTFIILAAALGGLFVVGLICIVAVFFIQRNQAAGVASQNVAMQTRNAGTLTAVAAAAQPTAEPSDTPTPVPPTLPPTNTPVVVTPAPTETPLPTSAPVTPSKATATATLTATTPKATSTAAPKSTATTAASSSSSTADATVTPESSVPGTGVGEFGLVLAAAALVAVLFIARRIRLVQR